MRPGGAVGYRWRALWRDRCRHTATCDLLGRFIAPPRLASWPPPGSPASRPARVRVVGGVARGSLSLPLPDCWDVSRPSGRDFPAVRPVAPQDAGAIPDAWICARRPCSPNQARRAGVGVEGGRCTTDSLEPCCPNPISKTRSHSAHRATSSTAFFFGTFLIGRARSVWPSLRKARRCRRGYAFVGIRAAAPFRVSGGSARSLSRGHGARRANAQSCVFGPCCQKCEVHPRNTDRNTASRHEGVIVGDRGSSARRDRLRGRG